MTAKKRTTKKKTAKRNRASGDDLPELQTYSKNGTTYARALYRDADGGRRRVPYGRFQDDTDRAEAKAAFDRDLAEWLEAGRMPPQSADHGTTTIAAVIEKYRKHKIQERAEQDAKRDVDPRGAKPWLSKDGNGSKLFYCLVNFESFCGSRFVTDLNVPLFESWVLHMVNEGKLSFSTIRWNHRAIRTMVAWAATRDLVPAEPAYKIAMLKSPKKGAVTPKKKTRARRAAIPAKDLARTLQYLEEPYNSIVRMIYATGCRPSELLRRKIGEVDRSDPELWCIEVTEHKMSAKVDHARYLYFDQKAQRILARFLLGPDDQLIFPGRSGSQPFHRTALPQAITRACKAAGVPHWTPYQLRDTKITEVARRHGIEVASDLAGHSDVSVTEKHYRKQAAADKAKRAAKRAAGRKTS